MTWMEMKRKKGICERRYERETGRKLEAGGFVPLTSESLACEKSLNFIHNYPGLPSTSPDQILAKLTYDAIDEFWDNVYAAHDMEVPK